MDRKNGMTVHEVAQLTGLTVRTLHYYDQIKLFSPSTVLESRYRIYSSDDIERLQEILFFKEIGFSLREIKALINSQSYSREDAMKKHLKILQLKKKRVDKLISLVNDTLNGQHTYTFDAFSNREVLDAQSAFKEEVFKNWSSTKEYQEYAEYFAEHTEQEKIEKGNAFLCFSQEFFERLAEYEHLAPSLPKVQSLVQEWQEYISENFYLCSNEMLLYLGELYISDEHFKSFIDQFSSMDLADYFNRAIKSFCNNKIKE